MDIEKRSYKSEDVFILINLKCWLHLYTGTGPCDCVRHEHVRRAGWTQQLVSERVCLHTPAAAHKKWGFLPWAWCVVCCITITVMTSPVSSNTRQVWERPVSSNLIRGDVHLLYRISSSLLASTEYGLPAYWVASTGENGKMVRRLVAPDWGRVENPVSSTMPLFQMSLTFSSFHHLDWNFPCHLGIQRWSEMIFKDGYNRRKEDGFLLFFFLRETRLVLLFKGIALFSVGEHCIFPLVMQPFLELGFSQLFTAKGCSMRWWVQHALGENLRQTGCHSQTSATFQQESFFLPNLRCES